MSAYSRSGSLRRVVASVVFPLVLLAFTVPLSPHEQGPDAECHHAATSLTAVSPGDYSFPACDHSAGTACAAMVGCVVLPSALASAVPRLGAQGAVTVDAPSVNGVLHGRLGFGPPTPPPNS